MIKDLTKTIGYIYKIISPSNKKYIGQTINLKQRKKNYKALGCKNQTKLYNSIKKYGWDKHFFEVIDECICGAKNQNLNEKEIYWIKFYDSFKNGLNCGEGGNNNLNRVLSKETIEKMRFAKLGKKASEETKKKMSDAAKGKNKSIEHIRKSVETKIKNGIYIFSDEHKKKLSEARKGKTFILTQEHKNNISKGHKGKILSNEHKKKLSESHKNQIPWNKGLKITE